MYSIGDVLWVQYQGYRHYGIYVGDERVIHNSKQSKKVVEVALQEFADSQAVNLSKIESTDKSLAARKARDYIGLPYNLFAENCEHFVRMVCGLVKESTQVQRYLVATLGGGALIKSDNPVLKTAGAVAAVTALLMPSEESPIKQSLVYASLAAMAVLAISKNYDIA